jgi:hypothetical protein
MKRKRKKDGTMELCIFKGSVYRTPVHCSDGRGEGGRIWAEIILWAFGPQEANRERIDGWYGEADLFSLDQRSQTCKKIMEA